MSRNSAIGTSFKKYLVAVFQALISDPMAASAVLTISDEMRVNVEAAKIRNDIVRVNISDVLEFLGLWASMFFLIT